MNNQDNVFWLEKPMILINTFNKFIPTKNMSTLQQMNAITLFCIYALILLKVVDLDNKFTTALFIGIIIILIFIYINRYKIYNNSQDNSQDNLQDTKLKSILKQNQSSDDDSFYDKINSDNTKNSTKIDYGKKSKKVNFVKDISVESGYYDSDDVLRLGEFRAEENRNTELDEMVAKTSLQNQHLLNQNREPTIAPTCDNPFVNPLLSDFNTDAFPYAVNADDDELKDKINLTYNKDLFRDLTDVFDVKNAERQFYTVPGGAIPNDQNKFAQWCYNTPSTCKEDTRQCNLIPTDIRYINNYK
jgi:hypothetical protein